MLPSQDQTAVERGDAFLRTVGDQHWHHAGEFMVFDPVRARRRLALHALRAGAEVMAFDAEELELRVSMHARRPVRQKGRKAKAPPEPEADVIRNALIGRGWAPSRFDVREEPAGWCPTVIVSLRSREPGPAMVTCHKLADELGLECWVSLREDRPLVRALARLRADLR